MVVVPAAQGVVSKDDRFAPDLAPQLVEHDGECFT
jgi:hypothetical protein